MTSPSTEVITLIVRLWFESSETDASASEWRGEIRHVPTGQFSYFRGLDGLVERIQAIIGQADGSSD
jgi:hypothetical protein